MYLNSPRHIRDVVVFLIVMVVFCFVAGAIFTIFSTNMTSGHDDASAKTNVFVNLKKGDIVLMNDGRACLVVVDSRWVLGSGNNRPETYLVTLSCVPTIIAGDFRVSELTSIAQEVAKPTNIKYETLASDYVRQIMQKIPK